MSERTAYDGVITSRLARITLMLAVPMERSCDEVVVSMIVE